MLSVLTYHRIVPRDDDRETTPGIASATVERFEAHVRFLARHYDTLRLADVLAAVRRRTPLPRRALLITFDDAYRDFQTLAWPVLKRHGVPATLFVPTAYVGCPGPVFWWDRLYRCLQESSRTTVDVGLGSVPLRSAAEKRTAFTTIRSRMKALMHDDAMQFVDSVCDALGAATEHADSSVLSWDALRSLVADGADVASHTHSHPLLNRVSAERVREEVESAQSALERAFGRTPPVLSYPNGAHDDVTLATLRQLGVEVAFTQLPGHNNLASCDPLRLRRINVTRRTSLPLLRLRLQPWFAPIERWRKRKRIQAYQSRPVRLPGDELSAPSVSRRGA